MPLNQKQTLALVSVREMGRIGPRLSEDEVLTALAFEKKTLKRKHIIKLLITYAVKFYKEKLHGSRQISCSE